MNAPDRITVFSRAEASDLARRIEAIGHYPSPEELAADEFKIPQALGVLSLWYPQVLKGVHYRATIDFPGKTWDGVHAIESWIETPPDLYPGLSIVLPLVDMNPLCGTVWWSKDPGVRGFWETQPRDPRAYHERVALMREDPFTRYLETLNLGPDALPFHVEQAIAGEALIFDSSLLHGLTHAIARPRITYDFRVGQ